MYHKKFTSSPVTKKRDTPTPYPSPPNLKKHKNRRRKKLTGGWRGGGGVKKNGRKLKTVADTRRKEEAKQKHIQYVGENLPFAFVLRMKEHRRKS